MVKLLIIALLLSFCVQALGRDPFQDATTNYGSKLAEQKPNTVVVKIHYKNASNIAKLLSEKNSHFLSPTGHITVDKEANTLWIRDYRANLQQLQKLALHQGLSDRCILLR